MKHGLVARVPDWPHSSFHRDVRRGIVPLDWAGEVGEGSSGVGWAIRSPFIGWGREVVGESPTLRLLMRAVGQEIADCS
jgi:hypothetical protein